MTAARIITVLNLKGGVGKTHTAWLLAGVAQERGQRNLLIDTDAQGNLSNSFLAGESSAPGVERLFHPGSDGDVRPLVRRTRHPLIDCVPASPAIAPYDLSDQSAWERAELHLRLVAPLASVRPQYDLVLIDCPPRLSLVSFAALCACDAIVIPLEAADWGAQGIVQVTEAVNYVQKHHNPTLRLLGYLVSRFKGRRTYQKAYLAQLRAHFGPLAFDTVVPDLAAFERSVTDRVPIGIHAPHSRAAAVARQLFDEVHSRLAAHPTSAADPRGAGGAADVRQPAASGAAGGG
jgi:chromosome partitioning protein